MGGQNTTEWITPNFHIGVEATGELWITGPKRKCYFARSLTDEDLHIKGVNQIAHQLQIEATFTKATIFIPDPCLSELETVASAIAISYSPDSRIQIAYSSARSPALQVLITLPKQAKITRSSIKQGFDVTCQNSDLGTTITAPLQIDAVGPRFTKNDILFVKQKFPTKYNGLYQQSLAMTNYLLSGIPPNDPQAIRQWLEGLAILEELLTPKAKLWIFSEALLALSNILNYSNREIDKSPATHPYIHCKQSDESSFHNIEKLQQRILLLGKVADTTFARSGILDLVPRLIIASGFVNHHQLSGEQVRLLRVLANSFLDSAQSQKIISFANAPRLFRSLGPSYPSPTWRDSGDGFANAKGVIAPYEVNAVWYPSALRALGAHPEVFAVDPKKVAALLLRWQKLPDKFQYEDAEKSQCFSLALIGKNSDQLKINTLDEGYGLLFGKIDQDDAFHFAQRLSNPKYFYSSAGPILTSANDERFTQEQKYGKLIWTKQVAIALKGIQKHLELKPHLAPSQARELRDTINRASTNTLSALTKIGRLTESHTTNAEPRNEGYETGLWTSAAVLYLLSLSKARS